MYHRNDCRSNWRPVLTNNGFCIVFNNDTDKEPHPKISVGRQTSLSFMLSFNDSDVTTGWWANFEGFTVFYSDPKDETIDPVYSIALNSGTVPIVSVEQQKTKLLGRPYESECLEEGEQARVLSGI